MNIYLASGNAHKLREFAELLCWESHPINLYGAEMLGGMPEVIEDGDSFQANAVKKAEALAELAPLGCFVLSDDSGLEIDALGGEPGVYSARYAGANASDRDNLLKAIEALKDKGLEESPARFVCALVLKAVEGDFQVFLGKCEGKVTIHQTGSSGFGYDPIFIPEGYESSFASLGASVKHQLSHRAKAAEALRAAVLGG